MLKTIEYQDAKGKTQVAAYADRGSVYQLAGKRERFAQLCAQGYDPTDAYCESHGIEPTPLNEAVISRTVKRLLCETAIVLRIADLKRPVLRKLQRKIEYNLQDALAQCQIAYDLAFEQGDTKGLLKAIEMQARLSKLLSEEINVHHKHGVLDEVATEVLLEMRKEIEVRRERQKRLLGSIEGEIVSVEPTPHTPSLESQDRVPSEAVPNTCSR